MSAKPDREAILPYIKVCQQLIRCGRMLGPVFKCAVTGKTQGPTRPISWACISFAQLNCCLLLSMLQAAALPDQSARVYPVEASEVAGLL